jgi:hypothetical protein
MMTHRNLMLGTCIVACGVAALAADRRRTADVQLLHPMFGDHAVLQRDRPITLYGAAPTR